jgi:polysaccharide biosynthesis protein PslE
MMKQKQDTGSLRDFLTVLFKHKSKIGTIFLVTVATVTIGSFLIPPVYEAKSSLLVKFGREYIYRPEVGDKSPVISINQDETINSEINILKSRDLIEKVITTLKVENIYPELVESPPSKMTPIEAAILKFEKILAVEGIKKSNVIEVYFQHKNPRIAARAINLLVDFYKGKHLDVYSGLQSSFLEKQLTTYDQKLKQSENELEAFKQKNRVFSLDEQRSLFLKQRMELDTDLKNTSNHIDELQKRLSSLKSQMKVISEDKDRYTETERDKIIVEAKAKLLDLKLKERELLEKYKESNRLVMNVRREIELVTDFIRQQEEDITSKVKTVNIVYQEVEKDALKTEADLNSQFAKVRTLRLQLSQVDREIQSINLNEKELVGLKREVSNNDKNYRTYVDKVEEARISDDMNVQKMANVSVIQAAAVPANPVKPKKALNILLGVILGAVSGLGFAFFSEFSSQGLSTPESVEKRLGLPVLATISCKTRYNTVNRQTDHSCT